MKTHRPLLRFPLTVLFSLGTNKDTTMERSSTTAQMQDRKTEISKYFRPNIYILQLVGLWPYEAGTSLWKIIFCRTFFVVGYTLHLLMFTAEILDLVFNWSELEDPADSFLMIATNFNSIIKVGCIVLIVGNFQRLVTSLEETFFTASEPFKEEKKKIIDWTLNLTRTITLTITTSCITTGVSFSLIPLTQRFTRSHTENDTSNISSPRPLPFSAWYPFDKTKSPYYEIAYVGQSVNMFYNGVYLSTTDAFIMTMIIHTFHQFKILQFLLRNIKGDTFKRIEARLKNTGKLDSSRSIVTQHIPANIGVLNMESVQNINDLNGRKNLHGKEIEIEDRSINVIDEYSDESSKQTAEHKIMSLITKEEFYFELHSRLVDWIKTHQAFITFATELEKLCSPFILVQLSLNVIFLVITALHITLVPVKSVKFITSVLFLFSDVTIMAVFSWCCGELAVQSAGIYDAAYESSWYEAPIKFKRAISIIMRRTAKPNEITAGKFVALNLATFTSVIKASYSYFTVLQHMYGVEEQE